MSNSKRQEKLDSTGYSDARYLDDLTLCNETWKQAIHDNPGLYCSAKQDYSVDFTEVHAAISQGRFFSADYILLQEDGGFKPGATPCLHGPHVGNSGCEYHLSALTKSAGSSFYLAYMVYRYFSESPLAVDKAMLADLTSGRINYLDTIYWLDESGEPVYYNSERPRLLTLQKSIREAPHYWKLATTIASLKKSVDAIDSSTASYEMLKVKISCADAMSSIYIDLAMNEEDSHRAFRWLWQHALDCMMQALSAAERIVEQQESPHIAIERKLLAMHDYVDIVEGAPRDIVKRVSRKFKGQTPEEKAGFMQRFNDLGVDKNFLTESPGSVDFSARMSNDKKDKPIVNLATYTGTAASRPTMYGKSPDEDQTGHLALQQTGAATSKTEPGKS